MRRLNQQHCPKSGFANPSGILQHSLEHWLKLTGRGADNLEDLRSRGFALARFGELAGELLDICFFAGSEGPATTSDLRRTAALRSLAAFRFYRFAACFAAWSHSHPMLRTDQTSTLEGGLLGDSDYGNVRFGSKADIAAV